MDRSTEVLTMLQDLAAPVADRLLSVAEASERLAVAPLTLRRWIRRGLVPSVQLGRVRRVRLGDVNALVRVGLPREMVTRQVAGT